MSNRRRLENRGSYTREPIFVPADNTRVSVVTDQGIHRPFFKPYDKYFGDMVFTDENAIPYYSIERAHGFENTGGFEKRYLTEKEKQEFINRKLNEEFRYKMRNASKRH